MFSLDSMTMFLMLVAFIVFIFVIKRIFSIVMNLLIICIVSLIFPFVMNHFFNFSLPTDIASLLTFMGLGVAVYLVYILASSVYKTLGIFEKIIRRFTEGNKTKKQIEKVLEEKQNDKKKKIKPINEKEYLVLKDKKPKKKSKSVSNQ